jgi:hypothetical protein
VIDEKKSNNYNHLIIPYVSTKLNRIKNGNQTCTFNVTFQRTYFALYFQFSWLTRTYCREKTTRASMESSSNPVSTSCMVKSSTVKVFEQCASESREQIDNDDVTQFMNSLTAKTAPKIIIVYRQIKWFAPWCPLIIFWYFRFPAYEVKLDRLPIGQSF